MHFSIPSASSCRSPDSLLAPNPWSACSHLARRSLVVVRHNNNNTCFFYACFTCGWLLLTGNKIPGMLHPLSPGISLPLPEFSSCFTCYVCASLSHWLFLVSVLYVVDGWIRRRRAAAVVVVDLLRTCFWPPSRPRSPPEGLILLMLLYYSKLCTV